MSLKYLNDERTLVSTHVADKVYDLDVIADFIEERRAAGKLPERLMDEWNARRRGADDWIAQRHPEVIGEPIYFLGYDIELAAWRHLANRLESEVDRLAEQLADAST